MKDRQYFIYIVLLFNLFIYLKAYEKYIILQLKPNNLSQLKGLNNIYENGNFDFWKSPTQINAPVDVLLTPETQTHFMHLISKLGLDYKILVSDVVDFLYKKEIKISENKKYFNNNNNFIKKDDSGFNNFGLAMGDYHNYTDVVNWMKRIEKKYPNFVKVFSIGKSFEGRNIYGIMMGSSLNDTSRRVIWIDSGIHAREWAAIHTGIYTIYHIINSYGSDDDITNYLNTLNIIIFPILNPDGYEYTRSDPRNPLVRFWRKNRGQQQCRRNEKTGKESCCKGVDLNRNFDYKFSQAGTSFDPCSEIYHGTKKFSEPETRAIRDAVINGNLTGKIDAMISLHAYSQLFIYPYSIAKNVYPENISDLRRIASKAVQAIKRLYGTKYQFGTGPELIYPYTGGSTDWAKESAKIQYTYTIEVRPSYFDWNGFVLAKEQLIPVARETWEGMKVVINEIISQINKQKSLNESTKLNISPEKCKDFNSNCKLWIDNQKDICKKALKGMIVTCPLSCNFCSSN
uniref:ShKT domain-containing protein n=1 Tax=Strongyloides venezuelensis TaxID=75913 RepID=A0A0K0FL36_STRVS